MRQVLQEKGHEDQKWQSQAHQGNVDLRKCEFERENGIVRILRKNYPKLGQVQCPSWAQENPGQVPVTNFITLRGCL